MSVSTLELIKRRVSSNFFDAARKLPEAEIRELIEYATSAPSSFNVQNWRFVAVREAAAKEKLKALAYGQPKVTDAAVTFIVLGKLKPQKLLAHSLAASVEAGILDQVTVDNWAAMAAGMYEGNAQLQRDEAIRSGSLAAMTMMLAAEAKGLASGPMIGFDAEGVRREFSIPDDEILVMLLPVGYAAAGNWPRKPRLPLSEILQVI